MEIRKISKDEKLATITLTTEELTDLHTNRWQVSGQKDVT